MGIKLKALFACLYLSSMLVAQQPLNHPKKMYKSAEGKVYANKHQPMYLFLGTSPNPASGVEELKSHSTPQYASPFYFDSEGLNTVRTPSQVDTVTKKIVYPEADIVFEVYADGLAPATSSHFLQAKSYVNEGAIFYNQNLKIVLKAKDKVSGVEDVYYSLNGSAYSKYQDTLSFETAGEYMLKYYAVDHVGNVEEEKEKTFTIDNKKPTVNWAFHGEVSGNTISGNSTIKLLAMDETTGIKSIKYRIDDGAEKTYYKPISTSFLKTGTHQLVFWAEDNVGNISDVAGDSNGSVAGVNNEMFSFVVDDVAPTVGCEIKGDFYKGKYQYVSGRSKAQIQGKDDLVGIFKILYSFNSKSLDKTCFDVMVNTDWAEPIPFPQEDGVHTLYYQANDLVSNVSNIEQLQVYVDMETPYSGVDYKGAQFFAKDTLFISENTSIQLLSEDEASGLKHIAYNLDGAEEVLASELKVADEGFHSLKYYALDNVNNKEEIKESQFYVDKSGPDIFINFSIKPIRTEQVDGKPVNVYSPFAKMYLAATDNECGNKTIHYQINDGTKKLYSSAIGNELKSFKESEVYTITVEAVDNIGNTSIKSIQIMVAKK
ncbi:OmpL47-type beta-barrel domain-containing protein [Labilibacter marinus]|uniref:OmpL47-type beta-barrel domain-containing protein n=1 Tax=Labilibacter marinus TaxID=1477105 RepID=UPI00094FC8E5|nr:Ig-like domain-containing protein [Labilibacter marinus]